VFFVTRDITWVYNIVINRGKGGPCMMGQLRGQFSKAGSVELFKDVCRGKIKCWTIYQSARQKYIHTLFV